MAVVARAPQVLTWKSVGIIFALAMAWAVSCGGKTVEADQSKRFHRYAMTKLDDLTFIDTIKDVATQKCMAVYIVRSCLNCPAVAAANLGDVPCEPIPVSDEP